MSNPYTFFEYYAAKLYFTDTKLHHLLDQADSGFILEESEWDSGVKNPSKKLNFHHLWDALSEDKKQFYRNLAKKTFYGKKEINFR